MDEQTAVVRLPLEGPIFALVENWRRSQPKIPSRNEATAPAPIGPAWLPPRSR